MPGRGAYGKTMASEPRYRWLGIAGLVALALAAAMLFLAWRESERDRRARADVGVRAEAMMNAIEAEARRMEREAGR